MAALLLGSFAKAEVLGHQTAALEAYPGLEGVTEACRRWPIVALPDRHQDSNSSKFRTDLISTTAFGKLVDDIVIEWGNRLYQGTLDRYIAGGHVSERELQKVWRNTVAVNGLWDSPLYEEFLSAVRAANTRLPKSHRLRVLAADPPIDWAEVRSKPDWEQYFRARDQSAMSVLESEVLAKHHKALLIMGSGHLLRGLQKSGPGVVDLIEKAHPNTVFVIGISPSIAQRLESYPPGSFFFTKGTWLQALSSRPDGVVEYDGLLTLLDGDRVRAPRTTYEDADYAQELDRRWRIVLGTPFDPQKLP